MSSTSAATASAALPAGSSTASTAGKALTVGIVGLVLTAIGVAEIRQGGELGDDGEVAFEGTGAPAGPEVAREADHAVPGGDPAGADLQAPAIDLLFAGQQVQQGADIIKITATGGVLSNTAAGLGQQFSDDELKAIVETAHSMGRKVTAHAHGADGINSFLKAGGDSIEHGTFSDAESAKLYKQNGAYLVPTLLAGDFVVREADRPGTFLQPAQIAKAREAGPKMIDMLRRMHQAGVKIAFGTDTGVSAHGDNAQEFALMVKAGMTPMQTIQGAERAQRVQFVTVVSQGTIQSAYRVPYSVFVKGEKADKMIIVGLQPGEMVVIAGRPSMGKTAVAINIAEHVAVHDGPHVRRPVHRQQCAGRQAGGEPHPHRGGRDHAQPGPEVVCRNSSRTGRRIRRSDRGLCHCQSHSQATARGCRDGGQRRGKGSLGGGCQEERHQACRAKHRHHERCWRQVAHAN